MNHFSSDFRDMALDISSNSSYSEHVLNLDDSCAEYSRMS